MVVHLLLAALQGAPIARRMQEMAAGGDSDCMKMAQDVETCPTGLKCMFDQSVPDCELDYSAFDNVKTCEEYFVAVSELDSVVLECYQAIAQDMFADIDIGGMTADSTNPRRVPWDAPPWACAV